MCVSLSKEKMWNKSIISMFNRPKRNKKAVKRTLYYIAPDNKL